MICSTGRLPNLNRFLYVYRIRNVIQTLSLITNLKRFTCLVSLSIIYLFHLSLLLYRPISVYHSTVCQLVSVSLLSLLALHLESGNTNKYILKKKKKTGTAFVTDIKQCQYTRFPTMCGTKSRILTKKAWKETLVKFYKTMNGHTKTLTWLQMLDFEKDR